MWRAPTTLKGNTFNFCKNLGSDTDYRYLFKLLRLHKVVILLEPRQFKNIVKDYYRTKIMKRIAVLKDEGKFSWVTREDHNHIMR